MKKCYLLVTAFLFAIGSSAQDRGEDYFAVGKLDKARAIFGSRISGDPAETNYYLGEIARAQGDSISARNYYEKGLAADPENAFCQVGLAVTELKKNPAEGDRMLTALAKARKNRKDPELLTAIARAYYDNGMTARGDAILEAAEAAGDTARQRLPALEQSARDAAAQLEETRQDLADTVKYRQTLEENEKQLGNIRTGIRRKSAST